MSTIKEGPECSFERYIETCDLAERWRQAIGPIMAPFDVVLTACSTREAPVGRNTTGNAKLALIWQTLHVPAISISVFKSPAGLPVGAYVVGKRIATATCSAFAQSVHCTLV